MPRPPSSQKRYRLNLEFPEKMRERIESLRVLTEADSITEVIRRALILYDFVLSPSFVSRSSLDDVLNGLGRIGERTVQQVQVLHCPKCNTIGNLHYRGRDCIGCDICLDDAARSYSSLLADS